MTEQEFIEAYDAYADAIFRHCYYRVYDREQAFDLAQETFTKSWEYIAAGKTVANIRAFLYRVANNLVIDASRKKRPLSLDELREQGFDPPGYGRARHETQADARLILDVLGRLNEQDRQVVVMRYIDDLGPKEMASILGESENVVSVRLHRALQRLRSIISQRHE